MTQEEALKKISELSCAYQHIRMTECPHCAKEVEWFVKELMKQDIKKDDRYDCPVHGLQDGPDCPRC